MFSPFLRASLLRSEEGAAWPTTHASALPSEADIAEAREHVRQGPKATAAKSVYSIASSAVI
jgi:hypothetical protein